MGSHTRQQTLWAVGGLLGALLLGFVILWLFLLGRPQDSRNARNLSVNQNLDDFFNSYWQRPIPLHGPPPASFTKKEASLKPEVCGTCHTQQYADWKESLHARAMGPGVWGQVIDTTRNDPGEAILCKSCHAPLSEQIPFLAKAGAGGETTYVKNPDFDSELRLQGITCAACHVRQHRRFGPPKAEGAAATTYPPGLPNHGGVERTPHFERAEFCRDCHQFDPDYTVLVNGKPLQDTFREWQNSIWGQAGASCHECHMPNRRHLWKGIHDPEMVRGGVRIETTLLQPQSRARGAIELTVEVTNAAVGHKFPTYITPKVFVRGALLDSRGKILPRTQQEKIIGWDVRFEGGEWKEYFDTRVSPGEKSRNIFRWSLPPLAKRVRAWVEVHPDHFYHVRFYPSYLQNENLSPEGRKLITKALEDSGRTPYILFDELLALR